MLLASPLDLPPSLLKLRPQVLVAPHVAQGSPRAARAPRTTEVGHGKSNAAGAITRGRSLDFDPFTESRERFLAVALVR